MKTLTGHTQSVISVAFSPNGRTLASASSEEIRLWDAATGQHMKTIDPPKSIRNITFSSDGRTLVSGGVDGILLWDVETAGYKKTITTNRQLVNNAVFSPDGRILAGSSQFGTRPYTYGMSKHGHIRKLSQGGQEKS